MVKMFVESCGKAVINVKTPNQMTPLLFACGQGHCEVAKYLIEQGADITDTDQIGSTCVHLAVEGNHLDVLKFLLSGVENISACVNKKNRMGFTPVHLAASCGNVEIMKALLECPTVDVSITNNSGVLLLFICLHLTLRSFMGRVNW